MAVPIFIQMHTRVARLPSTSQHYTVQSEMAVSCGAGARLFPREKIDRALGAVRRPMLCCAYFVVPCFSVPCHDCMYYRVP